MATRPSCSLCGGSYHWHGNAADARAAGQWHSRTRGIRGNKSDMEVGHPSLTGPGYISGGRMVASLDAEATDYVENSLENRHELAIHMESRPVVYAMHEVCWHLLLRRIGASPGQERLVAAWLFHVLASLAYSRAGGFITLDDESGASVDTAEIRVADPTLPLLPDFITDTALSHGTGAPESLFKTTQQPSKSDPFSCLPLEIMHDIFDILSSGDLCRARLASRCFANCAAPASLPQRFWASRFAHDKEMGFIDLGTVHARLPTATIDYYELYCKYRQTLKSSSIPEGLLNRMRIWSCLEHFAVTIRTLLSASIGSWESSQHPRLSKPHSMGQVISAPEISPASTGLGSLVSLIFGARIRHTGTLVIEGESVSRHPITLQVSSVEFNGRPYICGLRVLSDERSQQLGLMTPFSSSSVSLAPGTSIHAVDVYISIAGIHGMIIHTKTPAGREEAHSMGDTTPGDDSDTAVTRLQSQEKILALSVGFDMFKLARLQLVDAVPTSAQNPSPEPILWKSTLPPKNSHRPTHSRPSKDPLTLSPFLMHLYIPFGGKDGLRLDSLTRIAALLDGAIGLHGLIFTYDNREEVLYGARVSPRCAGPSRVCVEQSFIIDGPGGERIMELKYSSRTGSDALRIGYPGILALEVVTNFNRRHTFRAFDNYGNIRALMHPSTVRKSPDGECPTVLTIGLGAPAWFFETAEMSDFVSIPPVEDALVALEKPVESVPTEQILAFCPWMLSVGGSCFTTASLVDIRRVRVSVGADGRSRDRSNISGLWLEYEGHACDAILGQWMDELGEFTLKPQEALVEISARTTKETELRGTHGWVGKIVHLAFVTSLGKRYEFQQSEAPGESQLRYYATPYEDLGTLTWAFNSNTDDLQVTLTAAPALGPDSHLLLCDAEMHLRHPWLLQEDTRVFFQYGDLQPKKIGRDVSMHRYDAARRYFGSSEIFFWEERDPKGSGRMLRLRKIEVMSRQGIVDGFKFIYEGDLTRSFGSLDIDKHVIEFALHKNEKPSCLVVYYITDGRLGLELHTTRGKVCRVFPDNDDSNQADSHALIRGARAPKLTLADDPRTSGHHDFPDENPCGEPVSESVGIWVAGFPSHQTAVPYVNLFGPVYKTGGQVRTEQGDGKSGLRQTLRGLLRKNSSHQSASED